jgi:3-keto-5-aminohexanoate cleavage enzyme
MEKAILTCALTGVLTNPKQHPVPVTPAQMAAEARDAFNAGASIMHVHVRNQEEGMGHMPSWDPESWPRWWTPFAPPAPASSST